MSDRALGPLPDLATRFAVSAKELANALGVSERSIRDHQPEIPHVWIGNRILFPVDQVREWLGDRAKAQRSAGEGLANEIMNEMKDT